MSEFMLDIVWWQNATPGSALLGCESEWGNARFPKHNALRIAEDFDKLLSFKAPFKLMIFEAEHPSDQEEEILAELNRYLQQYSDHRKDEQYLVLNLNRHPAAWTCHFSKDGPNPSISLQELELSRP